MNSFKNRLLILIVALIALAQGATLLLVMTYVYRDTRAQSEHGRCDRRRHRRAAAARVTPGAPRDASAEVLISDFAFKEAVASGDPATIRSALTNHADRVGADVALMFAADGRLIASTQPITAGLAEALVHQTLSNPDRPQSDTFLAVLDGQPMQLVLTSVRAPQPIAWVAFGFVMNEAEARNLGALVDLGVAFDASGSPGPERRSPQLRAGAATPVLITRVAGEQYLELRAPLATRRGEHRSGAAPADAAGDGFLHADP